jgi:DNA-binding transcriptional regulator YiaG
MTKTKLQKFEVPIPAANGESVAERITVEVPVVWDEELKQFLLTPDAQKIIEDTKARHMGILLPNQLRELRTRLGGLSQKEIGELLQIGEKSWTRWESGKQRPSRSVNLLLRALYDGQIGIDYLVHAARPVSIWTRTIKHSAFHQASKRRFIRMDQLLFYQGQKKSDEDEFISRTSQLVELVA